MSKTSSSYAKYLLNISYSLNNKFYDKICGGTYHTKSYRDRHQKPDFRQSYDIRKSPVWPIFTKSFGRDILCGATFRMIGLDAARFGSIMKKITYKPEYRGFRISYDQMLRITPNELWAKLIRFKKRNQSHHHPKAKYKQRAA